MMRGLPGREVQQLVADLQGADPGRREAAVARLRVLGPRAAIQLARLATTGTHAHVRGASLAALEGSGAPCAATAALQALRDPDPEVRMAAVTVLRPWLVREDGTGVMDALVTVTLDTGQPAQVRHAALDAIRQLPREIVDPIAERAALGPADPLVDDPAAVHEWLAAHGGGPLAPLHDLVAHVRAREGVESSPTHREAWRAARGALHAALARRDSRVALYDLRETFDAATGPLPLDFLHAMGAIGDPSCLDALARAWANSPPGETWWRAQLAATARGVMGRHHLTPRHMAVKRLRERWPGFLTG